MTPHKRLTKTIQEAQSLLHEIIRDGGGRLGALYLQIDALQDVLLHVEYEMAHNGQAGQENTKQSRKAA